MNVHLLQTFCKGTITAKEGETLKALIERYGEDLVESAAQVNAALERYFQTLEKEDADLDAILEVAKWLGENVRIIAIICTALGFRMDSVLYLMRDRWASEQGVPAISMGQLESGYGKFQTPMAKVNALLKGYKSITPKNKPVMKSSFRLSSRTETLIERTMRRIKKLGGVDSGLLDLVSEELGIRTEEDRDDSQDTQGD